MGIRVLRMLRRLVVAEFVSAANEVKLTEAEIAALAQALHEAETTGGFWGEHPECEEFAAVVAPAVERILGARLSAREPDNEAESLRRWKAEATQVLDEWDRVWDALGKPGALGSSRALSSLAAVERLLAVPVSGVPTEAVRELAQREVLVGRIRGEASVAARAGQSARLERIAEDVERLYQNVALALEATYWDRPYDTRIEAIRNALWDAALVQRAAETNESPKAQGHCSACGATNSHFSWCHRAETNESGTCPAGHALLPNDDFDAHSGCLAAPRDQTEEQRALCSNCGADLTDHCSACGAMQ